MKVKIFRGRILLNGDKKRALLLTKMKKYLYYVEVNFKSNNGTFVSLEKCSNEWKKLASQSPRRCSHGGKMKRFNNFTWENIN